MSDKRLDHSQTSGGLKWFRQGSIWVLTGDRQKSAPNRVVLRDDRARFWARYPDGYHWTDYVKCPYTDLEEAKVWAKREYLLNYAGD